jgi:small subunit ribosomal protein S19e
MEASEPRTVKDVPADAFIQAYADYLKKTDKLEIPAWIDYAKTGANRELPPFDKDWLYTRTASIARKVYLIPNIGLTGFRRIYGGPKN